MKNLNSNNSPKQTTRTVYTLIQKYTHTHTHTHALHTTCNPSPAGIFCMKFGKNISKKVTKPDFSKKIPFLEKWAKRGQKWVFSRFFKVFSELDHETFLIFGMKLGKNICKKTCKNRFFEKSLKFGKMGKKGPKMPVF